jgi:hypothetical protein
MSLISTHLALLLWGKLSECHIVFLVVGVDSAFWDSSGNVGSIAPVSRRKLRLQSSDNSGETFWTSMQLRLPDLSDA